MEKAQVISKLREHEAELKSAGIMHLSLFGSVARDEWSSESDVDLLAEFDRTKRLSLIKVIGIKNRLTDILGVEADLSQTGTLEPEVHERAVREALFVF